MADPKDKSIGQRVGDAVAGAIDSVTGAANSAKKNVVDAAYNPVAAAKGQLLNDAQIAHLEAVQDDGKGGKGAANVMQYGAFVTALKVKRDAWEKAIKDLEKVQDKTSEVGTDRNHDREDALDKINEAQREYFALVECALPPDMVEAKSIPPLLSNADWAVLANVKSGASDEERKKAIEACKAKPEYAQFRGIISHDQLQRAQKAAGGESLDAFLNKNILRNNNGQLVSFSQIYGEETARQYMVVCAGAMQVAKVCQEDILTYSKVPTATQHPAVIDDTQVPNVSESVSLLAQATQYDYHKRAQSLREYRVHRGARSKYGDDVDAGSNEISKERQDLLKKIKGNENGPPFEVNGVKFEKVASVAMYFMRMAHPLDIFGLGWGGQEDRMYDVARLAKAWVDATADMNKCTPQDVVERLYAAGKQVPKRDEKDKAGNPILQDNQNLGADGQPINVMNINNFPMNGGLRATWAGLADLCVLLEGLGIAYNVNMREIANNQPNSDHLRQMAYDLDNDKDQGWAKFKDEHLKAARERRNDMYEIGPKDEAAITCKKNMAKLFDRPKLDDSIVFRSNEPLSGGVVDTAAINAAAASTVGPSAGVVGTVPTPSSTAAAAVAAATAAPATAAPAPDPGSGSGSGRDNDSGSITLHT